MLAPPPCSPPGTVSCVLSLTLLAIVGCTAPDVILPLIAAVAVLSLVLTLWYDGDCREQLNAACRFLDFCLLALSLGAIPTACLGSGEPLRWLGSLVVHGHTSLTFPLLLLMWLSHSRLRRQAGEVERFASRFLRYFRRCQGRARSWMEKYHGFEQDLALVNFSLEIWRRAAAQTRVYAYVLVGGNFLLPAYSYLTSAQIPAEVLGDWSLHALGLGIAVVVAGHVTTISAGLVMSRMRYLDLNRGPAMPVLPRLPEKGDVATALLGAVVETVSLTGLGLPPGISLAVHMWWKSRRDHDEESPARTAGEHLRIRVLCYSLNNFEVRSAMNKARDVRERLSRELGFAFPQIGFDGDPGFGEGDYAIMIGDREVARGQLELERVLAVGRLTEGAHLPGFLVTSPAGRESRWITRDFHATAEAVGMKLYCPSDVLSEHLEQILRREAPRFFRQMHGSSLLSQAGDDEVKNEALLDVACLLLSEGVSLRERDTILQLFEKYYQYHAGHESNRLPRLYRLIRREMGPLLYSSYLDASAELNVLFLPGNALPAYGTTWRFVLRSSLRSSLEVLARLGLPPVLMTTDSTRDEVARLLSRDFPQLVVLSEREIDPYVPVQILGEVLIHV